MLQMGQAVTKAIKISLNIVAPFFIALPVRSQKPGFIFNLYFRYRARNK